MFLTRISTGMSAVCAVLATGMMIDPFFGFLLSFVFILGCVLILAIGDHYGISEWNERFLFYTVLSSSGLFVAFFGSGVVGVFMALIYSFLGLVEEFSAGPFQRQPR